MQAEIQQRTINAAFTKQSAHYDHDELSNPVLHRWRHQVYEHIDQLLKPNAAILELNAGTGIDAVRFAHRGHRVHATDLSDGMIRALQKKVIELSLQEKITTQQISFERLSEVEGKFDLVFSNFGGLNCTQDLTKVTKALPRLLNPNAYVCWVIMPPICLWELSWVLKGQFKKAFRRLNKKTTAHLEGEFFTTYYHASNDIRLAFGKQFRLVRMEGLGVVSPPPASGHFINKYPRLTHSLNGLDQVIRNHFPFNRWGDHMIVSFHYEPQ